MRSRSGPRLWTVWPALLAPCVVAGLAPAGTAQPPAVAPAGAVSCPTAARSVARIALLDMWQVPTLQARDYRIAAQILEIAADLDPTDEDLLRRLIEAQDSAGEQARVLELSRRLLRPEMAPGDSVAQLRLISAKINERQNVDDRLAAYDQLLGPKGESLDPSIRSRLALDSAMLLRERGELGAFARRLSQAIELDPTNKDAASLAVAFHSERSDDAAARVDLMLVLLKADPIDPETYLALARELGNVGAYRGATRLYRATANLASALGLPADTGLLAEMHVAGWQAEGARKKIDSMRDGLETQRSQIEKLREKLKQNPAFLGDPPDPNEVQFDVPSARVLVAAASALGDEARAEWCVKELALSVKTATEPPKLMPGQKRPPEPPVTPEEKKLELADLVWMRLWAGKQIDLAEAQIAEFRADPDVGKAALERMEGWLAIRKGDIDGGRRILEPLAESDQLAELGLGMAIEAGGDKRGAGEWYAGFANRHPGSMAGAWARTHSGILTGKEMPLPPEAERLEAVVAGIPKWLEGFAEDARSFMTLQAEVGHLPPDRTVPGESYPVTIRVRNTSPIPLAVGAERAINSRFLLAPSVWIGKDRADDGSTMEVVSLSRRLRLMPQEAMIVTVRTDNGWLWRKLALAGNKEVKLRWEVVQGFRVTPDHIALPGPLCQKTETSVLTRPVLELAGASPSALAAAIRSGTPAQVVQGTAGVIWRLPIPAEKGGFLPEDAQQICAALAERYPTLDPSGRLMLLAMLPPAVRLETLASFDGAARNERDPTVLPFVLLTRVIDPADPLLGEAEHAADGPGASEATRRLAEVARLLRGRLADGIKGYSSMEDKALKDAIGAPASPEAGTLPSPASSATEKK